MVAAKEVQGRCCGAISLQLCREDEQAREPEMGRKIVTIGLIVIAVAAIAFLLGPRAAVDTTVSFDPTVIGADPQAYLASQEAAVKEIRPGLEKEIIWADPATKARTPTRDRLHPWLLGVEGRSAAAPRQGRCRPRRQPLLCASHRARPGRRSDGGRQRQRVDQRLCRGDRHRPGDRRQGRGDRHLDWRVAGHMGCKPGQPFQGCCDNHRDLAELWAAGRRLGAL